jgi:hypothetical protein
MDFYFGQDGANKAIIHATIDPDLNVLKFTADIDSIPGT